MPDLVVKTGSLAGRRITIDREMIVGRENTDVVFEDDGEVSRRHAVLRPAGGGVEIEDLGSTNGSFVNDRRIEGPTTLSVGDNVRIGQTTLAVEAAPGAADTVVSEIPAALRDRAPAPPAAAEPPEEVEEDVSTASLPQREAVRPRVKPTEPRDWRSWTAAAVLIALAVAAYLLFFGGDDFASAADEACRPAAQRVDKLGSRRRGDRALLRMERLLRVRSKTVKELRDLGPPPEVDKFLTAFSKTDRAITRFFRARQPKGARREYLKAARVEQKAAEELGLGSCADLTGV